MNLTDSFNRKHNYLRISLTDRCNLRCTYCMPQDKIKFSPRKNQMTANELIEITKQFIHAGVEKIRLTGGEPLIRKDFRVILEDLSKLPIQLAITTNGILLDQYFDDLKKARIQTLNISLDSLLPEKFKQITKYDYFEKVWNNIQIALEKRFEVKLNIVLIKGFNDDELIDFINLSLKYNLQIRFIEFMPFDRNTWDLSKTLSKEAILEKVNKFYGSENIEKLPVSKNATAHNFKIKGSKGSFGIISSVSSPFCDSCNRLRLTSDGKMKNCLFSNNEADLLTLFRTNKSIQETVNILVFNKKAVRAGMEKIEDFKKLSKKDLNRSMVRIGG